MVSAEVAGELRCAEGPQGLECLSVPPSPPQDQYRRDSIEYILKLVHNPECRLKRRMRPAILPISKTGPKVMTLNFQILVYG